MKKAQSLDFHSFPGILKACDAVGDIFAFWGFKSIHGRIWCLLYLHKNPLTADQIREALGISTGQASTSLQHLDSFGFVHGGKNTDPSTRSRKIVYTCEANLWKILTRVIQSRELFELDRLLKGLQEALGELKHSDSSSPQESGFAQEQIEALISMVSKARKAFQGLFGDPRDSLSELLTSVWNPKKLSDFRNWFDVSLKRP